MSAFPDPARRHPGHTLDAAASHPGEQARQAGGFGTPWDDRKIEIIIGNLLRAGVLLAAAVVLAGGLLFLVRHGHSRPEYHVFRGEPGDLRTVSGVLRDTLHGEGRGLIQLGLLLLLATPIARVAFSAAAFALQRDRLYVLITLLVLAILLFSLSGHAP
jgi:uncharacterized membrane protein